MDKVLLKFCQSYKRALQDIAAQKRYDERPLTEIANLIIRDRPEWNKFTLHHWRSSKYGHDREEELFLLDAEDLKYLFDKYSKKLLEELEQEKKALDAEYERAVRDLVS